LREVLGYFGKEKRPNVLLEGVLRMPRDKDREYCCTLTATELAYVRGTKPPKSFGDKSVTRWDLADLTVADPTPELTASASAAAAAANGLSPAEIKSAVAMQNGLAASVAAVAVPSAPPNGSAASAAAASAAGTAGNGTGGGARPGSTPLLSASQNAHVIQLTTPKGESFTLSTPTVDLKKLWLHFLYRTITFRRMAKGLSRHH
jgi:hypothetical protein